MQSRILLIAGLTRNLAIHPNSIPPQWEYRNSSALSHHAPQTPGHMHDRPSPARAASMTTGSSCTCARIHLRRAFHDVWKSTDSPIAREALEQIGKLYDIEAAINGQPRDVRHAELWPKLGDEG